VGDGRRPGAALVARVGELHDGLDGDLGQGEKEDAVAHHRVRIVIELRLVDIGPQRREGVVVVLRQVGPVAVVREIDVATHVMEGQVEVRQEKGLEVVLVGIRGLREPHTVDVRGVVVRTIPEVDHELARKCVVHDVFGEAIQVVRVPPLRSGRSAANVSVRERRETEGRLRCRGGGGLRPRPQDGQQHQRWNESERTECLGR